MRYRYSLWDPVFVLLVIATVVIGSWTMRAAPESIPLHFNAAGDPDRWGPPSFMNVIGLPLIVLLSTYPLMRLIDLYFLARKPVQYGFATTMGGGLTVFMAGLTVPMQLQAMYGFKLGSWFVFALLGLLYVFMGVMFMVARPETVPINNPGLFPDTPEARRAFLRATGAGFILSGVLVVPCAFFPGEWKMLSLVPLALGPVVGIIIGIVRAPKPGRT